MSPGQVEDNSVFFDRQERIEWWNQKKLFDSKVLVVGAGALGNEVIKNLALLGVGHLLVIDFDTIEDSNLSRAVLFREEDAKQGASKAQVATTRAKTLNPNKKAKTNYIHGDVVWDLGLGVYRHSDVIIGCLDNIEARLSVNLNSWRMGKTWIDGGMWELAGSVSVYGSTDFDKACYECGMTQEHYRIAKTRYSCTNSIVRAKIKHGFEPTTQTTSAVVGAIQSQEAVKILHGISSFSGRRLMFNGSPHFYLEENNPIYLIDLSVNPGCLCHAESRIENVLELPEATNESTLADLFNLLHEKIGDGSINIDLSSVFVVSSTCPYCEQVTKVNRPKNKVRDVDVVCSKCEVVCPTCGAKNKGVPDCVNCGQEDIYEPRLETFSQVSEESDQFSEFNQYKLNDMGVPLLQILRITLDQQRYFVEITGDISKIWE